MTKTASIGNATLQIAIGTGDSAGTVMGDRIVQSDGESDEDFISRAAIVLESIRVQSATPPRPRDARARPRRPVSATASGARAEEAEVSVDSDDAYDRALPMTWRVLRALLDDAAKGAPEAKIALNREVVLRVHVGGVSYSGGLRSASLDEDHDEDTALVLDADQERQPEASLSWLGLSSAVDDLEKRDPRSEDALDREVVLRVVDVDDELYVGGLRAVSVDDHGGLVALVLDGDGGDAVDRPERIQ